MLRETKLYMNIIDILFFININFKFIRYHENIFKQNIIKLKTIKVISWINENNDLHFHDKNFRSNLMTMTGLLWASCQKLYPGGDWPSNH